MFEIVLVLLISLYVTEANAVQKLLQYAKVIHYLMKFLLFKSILIQQSMHVQPNRPLFP